MERNVFSVSQINDYLKAKLEEDDFLSAVAVSGEISNYKLYPSGHHYFTLKDAGGALKCVLFRRDAMRLRFRPENGMQVIAMGRIAVYPRDGAYQLYCSALLPDGVGDLYAAFEQVKARLAAQGLFDEAHKKPIPKYPGVIGVVTSSAGAAVHDILRILRRRYPLSQVKLLPVRVQGVEAPMEIAEAICFANAHKLCDVLIVGRGGGSMEDLWAFNEEVVARAIYDSEIPVISAVGHEPDVTISDFVADVRAATPSNAAELAVPDQEALRQSLDSVSANLAADLSRRLKTARRQLDILRKSPGLQSPMGYLEQRRKTVTLLSTRLRAAQQQRLHRSRQQFVGLTAKLDAMSPLKVLSRGYALAAKADGTLVRSASQVAPGDRLSITLHEGSITATVQEESK